MALIKSIPIRNTGLVAEYWALSRFDVDMISGIATVKMAGYLTKQDRLDGKGPIEFKTVRWVGGDNPITRERLMAGQAFQFAYQKLMAPSTSPFNPNPFQGATPDL